MSKIQMQTPLVEMDGDEMTRVLWAWIKEMLIEPFVDLKTEYYDLGLKHRDETDDRVTIDSANAALKYGVAVKCATITPNAQRVDEYGLKEMWKSPNGTIRAILDGTVFRAPILVNGVRPTVRTWKKPITIARHAYGDVYKNTETRIPGAGKAELVFTGENGEEIRKTVFDFKDPGVLQGMYNLDGSIESFARSCFTYALSTKQDLWFSTKDTISKIYDHRFKDIFAELYEKEYREAFEKAVTEGNQVLCFCLSSGVVYPAGLASPRFSVIALWMPSSSMLSAWRSASTLPAISAWIAFVRLSIVSTLQLR